MDAALIISICFVLVCLYVQQIETIYLYKYTIFNSIIDNSTIVPTPAFRAPKGFTEMSQHQGKIDDASLLECHRCDALVIIGWGNKLCFILNLSSQALAETKCKMN